MNSVSKRLFGYGILATLVIGVTYRAFPIFAGQPALSQFFVTEDGYLMLTVARNMAIGLGMSVSDGTIATNGVQPLATYLFALPYLIAGGDKLGGLAGVLAISAAISVAVVFALRGFARKVLLALDSQAHWPWVVASLWFVSPVLLLHSMNALETGLYTLMVLLVLHQFGKILEQAGASRLRDRLMLGALCGVTFLARNDGAILVTAVFTIWALHALFVERRTFLGMVADLFPPGVLSLLIAAPWLINNKLNFGSVVPISATAQSWAAGFGQNLALLPAKLFEYLFPMLPVPGGLEKSPAFMLIASVVGIGILAAFLVRTWQRGGYIRYVVLAYALYGIALAGFYGMFFGAPHFMSRYMAPLAPLLILATVSVLIDFLRWQLPGYATSALRVASLAGIVLSLALLGRFLIPGVKEQGHFQVVDWVAENVPDTTWVGAVQTGTLGYWHDRTINLDGKVNPDALRELRKTGNFLNYILNSKIEYLADWAGIADWTTTGNVGNAEFSRRFEVVVRDDERNLGVLRRRAD